MKKTGELNGIHILILIVAYIGDIFILANYDGEFHLVILLLWIVVIVPPLIGLVIGISALLRWLKKRDLEYAYSKEKTEPESTEVEEKAD